MEDWEYDPNVCYAPDGSEQITFGMTGEKKNIKLMTVVLVAATPLTLVILLPKIVFWIGKILGFYLKKKTAGRKAQIFESVQNEEKAWAEQEKKADNDEWESVDALTVGTVGNGEKAEEEWDGVIGFLHPFCNAGGGGERVLWAAIRATQKRYPKAKCVVYTGDHDVSKADILARVKERFNINLHPPTVNFLYLTSRHWVLSSTWPRVTLLGQSLGSLIMTWDAFSLLPPDIFIDTMGYAFALGLSKLLLQDVPTGAYVHYPTISVDMLKSLDSTDDKGVNAGKGKGATGFLKKIYWNVFASIYSLMGGSIDVVMTNSHWTLFHIYELWGSWRKELKKMTPKVLYPPVAVEELEQEIEVSEASEKKRDNILLYIAQFRPEKNHQLILNSFAAFKTSGTPASKDAKLVLVGSVRDDADSKRVYELRLMANELHVKDSVEFHLDASWPEILEWLGKASVGVNGMWNEHFGIGVVEYQAAGLISVVHDSGGPQGDIVIPLEGKATGFHATTVEEFAAGFESALSLPADEKLAMRLRARQSAKRFTEAEFVKGWVTQLQHLVFIRGVLTKKSKKAVKKGKGKEHAE